MTCPTSPQVNLKYWSTEVLEHQSAGHWILEYQSLKPGLPLPLSPPLVADPPRLERNREAFCSAGLWPPRRGPGRSQESPVCPARCAPLSSNPWAQHFPWLCLPSLQSSSHLVIFRKISIKQIFPDFLLFPPPGGNFCIFMGAFRDLTYLLVVCTLLSQSFRVPDNWHGKPERGAWGRFGSTPWPKQFPSYCFTYWLSFKILLERRMLLPKTCLK